MGTEVRKKIHSKPIVPNPIGGKWIKKIDPVTGVTEWIRTEIKFDKKKRKKRK